MPEVTIKYNNPKTLKVLKVLSEYLDFTFYGSSVKSKKDFFINDVPVIKGNSSIDASEMTEVFTRRKIDAKKLREKAWRRNK